MRDGGAEADGKAIGLFGQLSRRGRGRMLRPCRVRSSVQSARSTTFERGWRGYLTDEEYEPTVVVVLCPECSERELGP
jgi:hypothetical protein